MKKIFTLILSLLLIFTFIACESKSFIDGGENNPVQAEVPVASETEEPAPKIELIIFAAASMTEAMNGIAAMYADIAPDVTFMFNFDSSGTLKTQIQEGADCDIFISASSNIMNLLDIDEFIIKDSRIDFVSNSCVLVVPEGNPAEIDSFEDISTDKVEHIAIGNSDSPAGVYAKEVFQYLNVWDELQSKLTFSTNVKEICTQVASFAVDCGVCFKTDAIDAGLEWVAQAEEGMHSPIIYPAAVIKTTKNEEAARAFLKYLKTDEVTLYLKSLGFSMP
jgi:molybdate transport system substrate-binding protein